jgi:hypothetical protein
MYVYKEPTDDPVLNIEEDPHVKRQSYITGDRMATFMLYLSEVLSYRMELIYFSNIILVKQLPLRKIHIKIH